MRRRVQPLQALRMLEGIVEPAERVAVFVAVLRNGEVEAVLRLEQHLCGADLQNVEDLARPFAREQQPAQLLKIGRLVLTQHDFEECLRLGRGQRLGICEQCQFPGRGARVGDCRDFLLLEVVGNAVARHLVGRIMRRPVVVLAQQATMPLIGVLGNGSAAESEPKITALKGRLSELGYFDGKNVYFYALRTRKSAGLMTRKLSVTESQ